MGLAAYPLASPLPTAPPSARQVNHRLLAARDNEIDTCGFIDGAFDNPITCDLGYECIEDTSASNQFCCDSVSFDAGSCFAPTKCIDSTALDCGDECTPNDGTVLCTDEDATICQSVTYLFSGGLQGWACGTSLAELTVYDTYTNDNGQDVTLVVTFNTVDGGGPTTSSASPSSTVPAPTPPSSPMNPMPVVTSPAPAPAASGLSTGAKAGIAVGAIGAVAIIAGLIFLIFIQNKKRRADRERQQNPRSNYNQPQMIQQQQPQPPPPQPPVAASPNLSQQHHMSMTSNPSATSTTPLTQANMQAMSHSPPPQSEVLPSESASQVQSPIGGGSVLSGPASPTLGYNPNSSHTGSQEHSGLGPLPAYPTGPSAFPHGGQAGGQSVLSNPNTFLSSPPVHAPGVDHYGGGQG